MDSKKNYMTPDGLAKLRAEYSRLFHDERPKIVETVAWAASNGDRSENADYIYGKRRLREIDSRLGFLTRRLEIAEVVDPKTVKLDRVAFGATVHLETEDGDVVVYQLVGEDETMPESGKISWRSPIGAAVLGKRIDDQIVVKRPMGDIVYLVTKVEYI